MEILADIPPLDGLSSPHLLVAGAVWRHDVVRALVSRRVLAGDMVTYIGGSGLVNEDRQTARDLRLMDLTDALGETAESVSRLKHLVLRLGGDGAARLASVIDDIAADSVTRQRTPLPVRGVLRLPIVLPESAGQAAAVIDDLEHHAREESLPPPQILSAGRPIAAPVARDALIAGDVRPADLTVVMSVRSGADGGQDWRPYAGLGVEPRLLPTDIEGAVDLVAATLRADPLYAAAEESILRDVARDHVHNERWTVALQIASPATDSQASAGWRMRHLLDAAATRGCTDAVERMRRMLGGVQRPPAWWTHPIIVVSTGGQNLALRFEMLAESLLDHGSSPALRERRKTIIIDDSQLIAGETGREALLRVARTARKYALSLIVAVDEPDELGQALGLMNNWIMHRETGSSAADADRQAELTEQGIEGFLRLGPEPVPIGRWYSSIEVTDGHRLLTGTASVTEVEESV